MNNKASLKKGLNETQARAALATKELAKAQYENGALQLNSKKAEVLSSTIYFKIPLGKV